MVDRLRADGEWVASHLSTVASPVAHRYLRDQSKPAEPQRARPTPLEPPTGESSLSLPAPTMRPADHIGFRRRPGPRGLTMRGAAFDEYDEYDDPVEALRYRTEITTRDVADLLDISQSTVRRWVARGYISPAGKFGPSNLFNTRDVLAAHDDIQTRRKATGKPRRQHRYGVELRRIDRIRPKHYDAVISIREAARLIDVSPSTIRSWIHRGYLLPLRSSKPRAVQLRLGDVVTTARSRRLPRRT
jgi:DNA-binding transcriptional MerR regulator